MSDDQGKFISPQATFNYYSPVSSTSHSYNLNLNYYLQGDEDAGQSDYTSSKWVSKQPSTRQGHATGYDCSICNQFNQYAELNCPKNAIEKTSFTCYSCREGLSSLYVESKSGYLF